MKISITCGYKDYDVKIKMVQEQLKMTFLLGHNLNLVI